VVVRAGLPLTNWRVYPLPITDTSVLCFPPAGAAPAPALAPAPKPAAARPAAHKAALAAAGSPAPPRIASTASAAARLEAPFGCPATGLCSSGARPLQPGTQAPPGFPHTRVVRCWPFV